MGTPARKLAIRPAALEWLGEALKLREVLEDKSAFEQALESLPEITLEAWPPGEDLLREGERGEDFYVVRSGRLSVWRAKDMARPRRLGTLLPGDFFGEIGFLLRAARSATVRAETDCQVFRFPAGEFSGLLRRHNSLSRWVKTVACKRLGRVFLGS